MDEQERIFQCKLGIGADILAGLMTVEEAYLAYEKVTAFDRGLITLKELELFFSNSF